MGYRIGCCEPPLDPPDDYWGEDLPLPEMEDEIDNFIEAVDNGTKALMDSMQNVIDESRSESFKAKYKELADFIDNWKSEMEDVIGDVQVEEYEDGEWDKDTDFNDEPPEPDFVWIDGEKCYL